MDNKENNPRLETLEEKIDRIYSSVEKTRLYFKWTMIISIAMVVLPLLASLIIIPFVMSSLGNIISAY